MGQTLGSAPVNPGCRRFINRESPFFLCAYNRHSPVYTEFSPPSAILRFVSRPRTVPRSCIYGLWEAFNDIAEGFGLTIEEFQEIVKSALLIYLNVTEKVLNVDTDNVFRLFDDDEVSCAANIIRGVNIVSLIFLSNVRNRTIWSTRWSFYRLLPSCRVWRRKRRSDVSGEHWIQFWVVIQLRT